MTRMASRGSSFSPAFYLGLAVTLLLFFAFQALFSTLPLFIIDLGGASTENGLAMWTFALASVAVRPVAGVLADHWRCRPTLVAGALLFGGAPLLYLLCRSIPALLVARAVHGAGMALYTTSYQALATALAPADRRGEALGLAATASTAAIAVAPLAGEWLVGAGGFRLLFLTIGGIGLAAGGLSLGLPDAAGSQRRSGQAGLAEVVRLPVVRGGAAAMALQGLPFGALVGFLPLLAMARGISPVGLAYTAYALALIVGGPLAGRLSDRAGRRSVILPGALVVMLAAGGLAIATRRWELLGLMGGYGLGWAGLRAGLDALMQDAVGPGERASVAAVQYAAYDLGVGTGAWLLGMVADAAGYQATFGLAAVGALLSLMVLMRLRTGGGARGD